MDPIPERLPPCAVRMLSRPEWFSDPGLFSRSRLAKAGWLPRFLSHRRFTGTEIGAITLGHTIHFCKAELYTPHTLRGLALLAHELKHVEQFEREGMQRFYRQYLWEYRKHGYSDEISLEAEAYQFERQVLTHLMKEFKYNTGRSICWHEGGPHVANNEFEQLPIEKLTAPE